MIKAFAAVYMITYNHASFIERAIKGVMNQKTEFPFKLFIGDDCSEDGTSTFCMQLSQKFPELISYHRNEFNLGANRNAQNIFRECMNSGATYIALCEGDDYWTNPHKLQKQVDFLEANHDYAICCHRVFKKKGQQRPKLYPDEYAPSTEATYDIEMMAKYGNLIATPSVVYRNGLFSSFPAWFDQSPIGDYVLHMLNAHYGRIKYFPDPMAVYREHSQGYWSGNSVKGNAANMIKVIGFLLTEAFDESVKKGLNAQLQGQKVIYLNELLREDKALFSKEFNAMIGDDPAIALALIEKIKKDEDSFLQSREYKFFQKIRSVKKVLGK